MKNDIHPDYHFIDVKMTDGTIVKMRSTVAKATRSPSTSTRRCTRPGPAATRASWMLAVVCPSSKTNTLASASKPCPMRPYERPAKSAGLFL